MLLWLLLFMIIVFIMLMFIITPYESEKTQQKVMIICGIVSNMLFGINTPTVIPFLLMKLIPRGYNKLHPDVLIWIFIYMSIFIILNALIFKKGKIDLKKYIAWSALGCIIGFLINGIFRVKIWMTLALL